MPHVYDGSMNDGFCADCDKPRQDVVHHVEPSWREAWERSRQIQRALRERGTPDYHVRAQAEYDYCHAVSETPRTETPPTAKEWFRAEDVSLPRAAAVDAPESKMDLHAVRAADSADTGPAGTAPLSTVRKVPCSVCGEHFWAELLTADQPPPYFCPVHGDQAPWMESRTRWQEIAKDRGGSYWQQVQPHLWAIAFLVVGVIIGAFSVKTSCP